ncbi:hypothetical protein BGX38DRAFT_1269382 [Terfezia claveryi]|nr:hypothetical protein BGX38DRAFT_1269382 [Terfezia claveryi]
MEDIFKAAREGSLNERAIRTYKLSGAGDLNAKDSTGLTLLCSAVIGGHPGIVQRLLNNGAQVDEPSAHNCTALWFATRLLDKECGYKITRELVKRGAKVDMYSDPTMLGTTPLMNSLRAGQGLRPGTISLLLSSAYNAKTGIPSKQKSAEADVKFLGNKEYRDALAKQGQLMAQKQSKSYFVSAINNLLGFLVKVVNRFTNNVLSKKLGFGGTVDQNAPAPGSKALQSSKFDPVTFNQDITKHVYDKGLDMFFPSDSPFLKTVIDRATTLAEKGDSALAGPDYLPGLTQLSLYQPIFFCDNSGSMKKGARIDSMIDIIGRLTDITTRLIPDDEGVEIRFLNSGPKEQALYKKYSTVTTAMDAGNMLTEADYGGVTRLGTVLRAEVLKPYIYDVLETGSGQLKRPLLISIITDGCPYGEGTDELYKAIIECKTKLKGKGIDEKVVKFQISQIGDDEAADAFLGRLANDPGIKDYIYVTSGRLDEEFNKLYENEDGLEIWFYKTLMGPVLQQP